MSQAPSAWEKQVIQELGPILSHAIRSLILEYAPDRMFPCGCEVAKWMIRSAREMVQSNATCHACHTDFPRTVTHASGDDAFMHPPSRVGDLPADDFLGQIFCQLYHLGCFDKRTSRKLPCHPDQHAEVLIHTLSRWYVSRAVYTTMISCYRQPDILALCQVAAEESPLKKIQMIIQEKKQHYSIMKIPVGNPHDLNHPQNAAIKHEFDTFCHNLEKWKHAVKTELMDSIESIGQAIAQEIKARRPHAEVDHEDELDALLPFLESSRTKHPFHCCRWRDSFQVEIPSCSCRCMTVGMILMWMIQNAVCRLLVPSVTNRSLTDVVSMWEKKTSSGRSIRSMLFALEFYQGVPYSEDAWQNMWNEVAALCFEALQVVQEKRLKLMEQDTLMGALNVLNVSSLHLQLDDLAEPTLKITPVVKVEEPSSSSHEDHRDRSDSVQDSPECLGMELRNPAALVVSSSSSSMSISETPRHMKIMMEDEPLKPSPSPSPPPPAREKEDEILEGDPARQYVLNDEYEPRKKFQFKETLDLASLQPRVLICLHTQAMEVLNISAGVGRSLITTPGLVTCALGGPKEVLPSVHFLSAGKPPPAAAAVVVSPAPASVDASSSIHCPLCKRSFVDPMSFLEHRRESCTEEVCVFCGCQCQRAEMFETSDQDQKFSMSIHKVLPAQTHATRYFTIKNPNHERFHFVQNKLLESAVFMPYASCSNILTRAVSTWQYRERCKALVQDMKTNGGGKRDLHLAHTVSWIHVLDEEEGKGTRDAILAHRGLEIPVPPLRDLVGQGVPSAYWNKLQLFVLWIEEPPFEIRDSAADGSRARLSTVIQDMVYSLLKTILLAPPPETSRENVSRPRFPSEIKPRDNKKKSGMSQDPALWQPYDMVLCCLRLMDGQEPKAMTTLEQGHLEAKNPCVKNGLWSTFVDPICPRALTRGLTDAECQELYPLVLLLHASTAVNPLNEGGMQLMGWMHSYLNQKITQHGGPAQALPHLLPRDSPLSLSWSQLFSKALSNELFVWCVESSRRDPRHPACARIATLIRNLDHWILDQYGRSAIHAEIESMHLEKYPFLTSRYCIAIPPELRRIKHKFGCLDANHSFFTGLFRTRDRNDFQSTAIDVSDVKTKSKKKSKSKKTGEEDEEQDQDQEEDDSGRGGEKASSAVILKSADLVIHKLWSIFTLRDQLKAGGIQCPDLGLHPEWNWLPEADYLTRLLGPYSVLESLTPRVQSGGTNFASKKTQGNPGTKRNDFFLFLVEVEARLADIMHKWLNRRRKQPPEEEQGEAAIDETNPKKKLKVSPVILKGEDPHSAHPSLPLPSRAPLDWPRLPTEKSKRSRKAVIEGKRGRKRRGGGAAAGRGASTSRKPRPRGMKWFQRGHSPTEHGGDGEDDELQQEGEGPEMIPDEKRMNRPSSSSSSFLFPPFHAPSVAASARPVPHPDSASSSSSFYLMHEDQEAWATSLCQEFEKAIQQSPFASSSAPNPRVVSPSSSSSYQMRSPPSIDTGRWSGSLSPHSQDP